MVSLQEILPWIKKMIVVTVMGEGEGFSLLIVKQFFFLIMYLRPLNDFWKKNSFLVELPVLFLFWLYYKI